MDLLIRVERLLSDHRRFKPPESGSGEPQASRTVGAIEHVASETCNKVAAPIGKLSEYLKPADYINEA